MQPDFSLNVNFSQHNIDFLISESHLTNFDHIKLSYKFATNDSLLSNNISTTNVS